MKQLSLNSQAIILLTAYFNKNDKPLTITEYSNLATWLLKYNMTPADLLATNNIDILKEYEGSKIIQDRILSLALCPRDERLLSFHHYRTTATRYL